MTEPLCPFCGEKDCRHFIGWTDDGRTIELRKETVGSPHRFQKLLDTDRTVNTGVSTRVYRDWVFA